MKPFFLLFLSLTALTFVGCSTVQTRIEEKAHVFNTLNPDEQSRIRQGLIDIGYTTDMVYMAMGEPDETRERTTNEGQETTWVYNAYWQEYEGSRMVGYHRVVYFDRVANAYRVYYRPVHADIYSDREEERTRVQFRNGRVTAIEQVKE